MEYLKTTEGEKKIKQLSRGIALLIILEIAVILLQGWQASDSYAHLQVSMQTTKSLTRIEFIVSNALILINTAIVIYIASRFFRKIPLEPLSYLWGIRAGFLVFIVSCFLGEFLLYRYGQSPPNPHHFGLPFTQFASARSNLISLHFLGLHYLQLLPICCYFLRDRLGKFLSLSSTAIYLGACLFFIRLII
jgi:hypothetical protein